MASNLKRKMKSKWGRTAAYPCSELVRLLVKWTVVAALATKLCTQWPSLNPEFAFYVLVYLEVCTRKSIVEVRTCENSSGLDDVTTSALFTVLYS